MPLEKTKKFGDVEFKVRYMKYNVHNRDESKWNVYTLIDLGNKFTLWISKGEDIACEVHKYNGGTIKHTPIVKGAGFKIPIVKDVDENKIRQQLIYNGYKPGSKSLEKEVKMQLEWANEVATEKRKAFDRAIPRLEKKISAILAKFSGNGIPTKDCVPGGKTFKFLWDTIDDHVKGTDDQDRFRKLDLVRDSVRDAFEYFERKELVKEMNEIMAEELLKA